jgi:hypothetical protein
MTTTRTLRLAAVSSAVAVTALISGATISATSAEAGHRHHHHRHFGKIFFAAPVAYYGASYYGGGGCGWLYRRAEATGSRYWWNRYHACKGY